VNDRPEDQYESFVTEDYEQRVKAPAARAVQDKGRSGGTLVSYPSLTIVPEDYAAKVMPGQISELGFLHRLAAEIATRLPGSPGHGDERAMLEQRIEAMLQVMRDRIVKPRGLEEWLRQRLRVQSEEQLSVEGWLDRFLREIDVSKFVDQFELLSRITRLTEEEQRLRYVPDEDDEDSAKVSTASVGIASAFGVQLAQLEQLVAQCMIGVLPCLGVSRLPRPANSITPTGIDGQLVHLMIQEHYLLTHPGHIVMMESMVNGPNFQSPIQQLGNLATSAHPLYGALRFALGTIKEYTKLPDILDYTAGEVYEIKPRQQVLSGRIKLCRTYISPFNLVAPTLGLNLLRPGTSWHPSPAYWVPPFNIALTLQCPGLIIYDLFAVVPPQLRPEFVRLPVQSKRRQLSSSEIALVVMAIVLLLLLFALSEGLLTPVIAWLARLLLLAAFA
jgi:hypothetical protein